MEIGERETLASDRVKMGKEERGGLTRSKSTKKSG